jgi:uncharacterized DUF497 family protein
MRSERFEWDDGKAARNYSLHGVSFALAAVAFDDPFALDFIDDRFDYGEERFILIGSIAGIVVYVVYTEREMRKRLISARRAVRTEHDAYVAQRYPNDDA